jgi:hypothetical protein
MRKNIKGLLQVPYAFTLMNWAVVAGLFYFLRGHEDFWNPKQAGRVTPLLGRTRQT